MYHKLFRFTLVLLLVFNTLIFSANRVFAGAPELPPEIDNSKWKTNPKAPPGKVVPFPSNIPKVKPSTPGGSLSALEIMQHVLVREMVQQPEGSWISKNPSELEKLEKEVGKKLGEWISIGTVNFKDEMVRMTDDLADGISKTLNSFNQEYMGDITLPDTSYLYNNSKIFRVLPGKNVLTTGPYFVESNVPSAKDANSFVYYIQLQGSSFWIYRVFTNKSNYGTGNQVNDLAIKGDLRSAKNLLAEYVTAGPLSELYRSITYGQFMERVDPESNSLEREGFKSHLRDGVPLVIPEKLPGISAPEIVDYDLVEVDGEPFTRLEVNNPSFNPNIAPDPLKNPKTLPYYVPYKPLLPGEVPQIIPGIVPNPDYVPEPGENPDYVPNPGINPDVKPNPNPDPKPDGEGSTEVPTIPEKPDGNPDGKMCKKWDGEKLIRNINQVSTKFPFSIPWDVFRAFEAVFGGIGNEKPTIMIPSSLFGKEIPITMPDFIDKHMPFLRNVMVIGFDISIIYALRKWFGGAE